MIDLPSETLKSYEEFAARMNGAEAFTLLSKHGLERLFRGLYNLCSDKELGGKGGQIAKESVSELRGNKRQALKAADLLGQARQTIRKACTSHRDQFLIEIEDLAPEWGLHFTFCDIEKSLHFSVEWLKAHAAITAASIHHQLRNPQEKRLVKEHLAVYSDCAEGAEEPNYPASEKMRELDTMLIHDAAKLIKKAVPGIKPSRLNQAIVRLFEAAFGTTRTEDSIRKALLKRGKSFRRPESTSAFGKPVFLSKGLFPNTDFLSQPSPCCDPKPSNS